MPAPEQYDILCSIGDLIDLLCVALIKCSYANHAILDERRKPTPDAKVIANMEWVARTAGEKRVKLRDELNRRLDEAIRRGGIQTAADARTYDLRGM